MSDALPLPSCPSLEQYKKLAKDLQQACQSVSSGAIPEWAMRWPDAAEQLQQRWRKFQKSHAGAARCALTAAQLFLARAHGFASWPAFAKHLEECERADSRVSQFEAAADAIVSGDLAALAKLLGDHPELARARSTREHRSTLLHYVSANGVEDFRQKTPGNIVEITRLLLAAGADVNAESEAYGGGSTTLGLTATSAHPENAGVQRALMELLIEQGATIDGVNACLRNGRGSAAAFLASRGAPLDLEGACGVGRLDRVRAFFSDDGRLLPTATEKQMHSGLAWACEFGHLEVVEFLLDRGVEVSAPHHGPTGLHWAALGGSAAVVKLLLRHQASVHLRDANYGATPLGWALHSWSQASDRVPADHFHPVIALLVAANAEVEPEWLADAKIRADPELFRILSAAPARNREPSAGEKPRQTDPPAAAVPGRGES